MTDTAQPLPDEQNDEGSLTPEMQQRAAALGIARSILKSTAIFGQTGVQNWSVQDLLTVGDYILGVGPFVPLEGVGGTAEQSPETARDASNKAYFDSGWEAVRREALSMADQNGATAAIDWLTEHPAGGRLIDGPDTLSAPEGPAGWWAPIDDAQAAIPSVPTGDAGTIRNTDGEDVTDVLPSYPADEQGYPEDALPR